MAEARGDQMNVLGPAMLMADKTNVIPGRYGSSDGVAGEEIDELGLDLSDKELESLAEKWENDYNSYDGRFIKRRQANK